jgi:hypothetical protein
MNTGIPNCNDRNFKSLLVKLKSYGWMERIIDTPKTATTKRNFEFCWTIKGQLYAITAKKQMKDHPLWKEVKPFLDSLNEQEEAFLHSVFLSTVPDNL